MTEPSPSSAVPLPIRRRDITDRHQAIASLAVDISAGTYRIPAELVADALLADAAALRHLKGVQ